MFQCFECFLPVVRGRLVLLEQLAFRFVEAQAAQSVLYTEVNTPSFDDGNVCIYHRGKRVTRLAFRIQSQLFVLGTNSA